jgi:hypothetical protein
MDGSALSEFQRVIPHGAQDTYDITVDDSHSFSVDGIHLHAFHTAEAMDPLVD